MIETAIALSILYILLTGFCLYYWIKTKYFKHNSDFETGISVVIALRNEEKNINALLTSLENLEYSKENFEIILVDDGSSDNSVNKINDFAASSYSKIRVTQLPAGKTGKKNAVAQGVELAKFSLIATTDADCLVPQMWLKNISSCYTLYRPKLIVMPVKINGTDFFSHLQALEFMSLQAATASFIKAGFPLMCNGANLAFEKEIYKSIERNDINIPSGDDTFLMLAIDKKFPGSILWLKSGEVIIKTGAQKNLQSFLNQRIRWASKVKHYKCDYITITGLLIVAMSFFILLTGCLSIYNSIFLIPFAITFGLRLICDFIFLAVANSFFRIKIFVVSYPVVQLMYPFYILSVCWQSIRGRYIWKGRKSGQ